MRFIQASPTAPNVDVLIDGKIVITNLAYLGISPASGYLTILGGTRELEMRSTGMTADLINSNVAFSTHHLYTVLASGTTANIAAVQITDDNSVPSTGNVKLRIIQGSTTLPNLDVYIVAPGTDITNMPPTVSGLAYQQASGYQSVSAASAEIIFTDPTNPAKTRLIDYTFPSLAAGQIRTLVAVDIAGGSGISSTPLVLADLN